MSQDGWFLDTKCSLTHSPTPGRKANASPIFQIVPDHRDCASPDVNSSSRITPVSSPIGQRRDTIANFLDRPSSLFSRTASNPAIVRQSSPLPPFISPDRSRSRFARSTLDVYPTEPRCMSSLSSPVKETFITRSNSCRLASPSPTRKFTRSQVAEMKNKYSTSPNSLINKWKKISPTDDKESTCVSSTTTTTKLQEGKGLLAQSVTSTSITINKPLSRANSMKKSSSPVDKSIRSTSNVSQTLLPESKTKGTSKQQQQINHSFKLQTSKSKVSLIPPAVIESRPPVTPSIKRDASLLLSKRKKFNYITGSFHDTSMIRPFTDRSSLSPSPIAKSYDIRTSTFRVSSYLLFE